MTELSKIKNRIDVLEEEIVALKKTLIASKINRKTTNKKKLDDLKKLSKEVSRKWKGHGAVEEIKKQRNE